jgi:hypothetical protein
MAGANNFCRAQRAVACSPAAPVLHIVPVPQLRMIGKEHFKALVV